MIFTISGKHIDITKAIRDHAEQKTSKLPRFYSGVNQIEVIIAREPSGGINVEIIARGEHSKVFIGTERGEDVYGCIDIAIRKLERQLKKKKGKERDNKKHAGGVEKREL